jgi:C1A family cysteine protease
MSTEENWKNYRFDAKLLSRKKTVTHAENIYPNSRDLLPKTLDYRNKLQPIRDQGAEGSCVAQSAAAMKEWQELKDVDLNTYLSVQMIYDLRSNRPQDGMVVGDAMDILKVHGICYEKTYPYGNSKKKENIPAEIFTEAANYKILGCAKVNTIDTCKTALYKNGPCLLVVPVYNVGPKIWVPDKPTSKPDGGHCMTIVGYDDDQKYFIVRNSWGTNYADRGYTYFPYSDWGRQYEVWTSLDAESSVPINPPPPPSPSKKKKKYLCF